MIDQDAYYQRVRDAAKPEHFDLAEHMPESLAEPVLGRVKPEPRLHTPALNLADYIEAQADPPPAVHRSHLNFPWGMLMNDSLGDCGDAMALHGIEAFHLDAGTPVPPFRDQDAEALYEEVSGYVPGDPSTDNGTDNRQLFTYWEDPGITCHADGSNHRIAASLFFDPKDERTAKIGMWEFVVAFWAVGLPLTAQRQAIWDVTDPALGGDAAVGSWGFHDVCRLSFSAAGVRFISWGQGMLETWAFDRAYGVQGIVVVSLEQLSLKGISPSGVNWDRLGSDLRKLPSVPAS